MGDDKPFCLEDIIEQWQIDYCELKYSKNYGAPYYETPIKDRKELLKILIAQIKEIGKEQNYFQQSRLEDIVKKIIPKSGVKSNNADNIKIFKECALQDLRFAVKEVYNPKNKNKKYFERSSEQVVSDEPKVIKKPHDKSKYKDEPPVICVEDEELLAFIGSNKKDE